MQSKFATGQQVDLMVPRLTASYYDRTGHLTIVGIIRVLAESFYEAEEKGFFTAKFGHMRAYTVQEDIFYSPKLQQKTPRDNVSLLHRVTFVSLGKTSFSIIQTLIDPLSMEQLVRLESKVVSVDSESRRPLKLPEWVNETFSKFPKTDLTIMSTRQEDLIPPPDAFRTLTRSRPSDMDTNFHVNFAVFYRFCTDCATEASLAGYYRYYKEDMCWYPILETKVTFLGEAPSSVNLDVYSWQETHDVQRFYFAIYLRNKRIFQASFLYSMEKLTQQDLSKL
ncbi:uncharacterized protein LOC132543677 [Ylistrum balloti]|uniref:uncharacterized protein LOC132543677 n=1 Tax=Ylistrum balloti TaxID=509963 RepID=UPI002905EEEE|nr:uncharacterized protein LOC132543677 [Ylistrum balloti]